MRLITRAAQCPYGSTPHQLPASLPSDVFVKLFGPRCSAAAALPSAVRHAAVPHPVLRDVVAPYLVVGTIQFQTPLEVVRATECLSFDMTLVLRAFPLIAHTRDGPASPPASPDDVSSATAEHLVRVPNEACSDGDLVDVFGVFMQYGWALRRVVVERHRVPAPLRLIAALIERWAPRLLLHHTVRHRTALYKAYARGGGGRGVTDFGCPLSEALADVPIAREVLRQAAPTLQVYAEGTRAAETVILSLVNYDDDHDGTDGTCDPTAKRRLRFPRLRSLSITVSSDPAPHFSPAMFRSFPALRSLVIRVGSASIAGKQLVAKLRVAAAAAYPHGLVHVALRDSNTASTGFFAP